MAQKKKREPVARDFSREWKEKVRRPAVVYLVLWGVIAAALVFLFVPALRLQSNSFYLVLGLSLGVGIIGPVLLAIDRAQVEGFFAEMRSSKTPEGFFLQLREEREKIRKIEADLKKAKALSDGAVLALTFLGPIFEALTRREVSLEGRERTLDDMQAKVINSDLRASEAEKAKKEAEGALAKANTALDQHKAELRTAREEAKELRTAASNSSASADAIQELLDTRSKQLTDTSVTLTECQGRLSELNKTLLTVQTNLYESEAKLAQSGTRLKKLESDLSEARIAARDNERTLRLRERQVTQGAGDLEKYKREQARLESELRGAREELELRRAQVLRLNWFKPAQLLYADIKQAAAQSDTALSRILAANSAADLGQALACDLEQALEFLGEALAEIPLTVDDEEYKGEKPLLIKALAVAFDRSRRYELLSHLPIELVKVLFGELDTLSLAIAALTVDPQSFTPPTRMALLEAAIPCLTDEALVATILSDPAIFSELFLNKELDEVHETLASLPETATKLFGALLWLEKKRFEKTLGNEVFLEALVDFLPTELRAGMGRSFADDATRQTIILTGGRILRQASAKLESSLTRERSEAGPNDALLNKQFELVYSSAKGGATDPKKNSSDPLFDKAKAVLTAIIAHTHPLVWRRFLESSAGRSKKAGRDALDMLIFWDLSVAGSAAAGINDYMLEHLRAVHDVIDLKYNRSAGSEDAHPTREDRIGHLTWRFVKHRGGRDIDKLWLKRRVVEPVQLFASRLLNSNN